MRNKSPIIFIIVGGLLLILAGALGSSGLWGIIIENIQVNVSEEIAAYLETVLRILNYIALFGGIAIVVGGILIAKESIWLGKFFVLLGLGFGLLGFLFLHLLMAYNGAINSQSVVLLAQTPGWIGQVLALYGRGSVKKKDEE